MNLSDALRYDPKSKDQARQSVAWTLIVLSLVSLIACISYYFTGNADQSAVESGEELARNWLGSIGAWLADLLIRRGFGFFGVLIPAFGLLLGLVMLENEYYHLPRKALKYVVFLLLFGSVFFSMIDLDMGGGVGANIHLWLRQHIGQIGIGFLLLLSMILFMVINFNAEIRASQLLEMLKQKIPQPATTGNGTASRRPKRTARNRPSRLKPAQTTSGNETSVKGQVSRILGIAEESPVKEVSQEAEKAEATTTTRTALPEKEPQTGSEISFELVEPKESKSKKKQVPKDPSDVQLELTIVPAKDEPVIPFEPKKLEQIGEDNIGRVLGEDDKIEKIVPEKDQEIENIEDLDWEDFDPTP